MLARSDKRNADRAGARRMAGNGDCWPVKIVRDGRIAKAFGILCGLGLDIAE